MKTNTIASLLKATFWLVIAALAALVMVSFMQGNNPFDFVDQPQGPITVLYERTVAEEITKLNINWNVGGVEIKVSEDDHIHIVERGRGDVPESKWASFTQENGSLTITSKNKNFIYLFFWHTPETYLELRLPKITYDSVMLNVTSGNNTIDDLSVDRLTTRSTSGILRFNNLTANTLKLDMTSGQTFFEDSIVPEIDAVMTSGTFNFDGVIADTLDLTMTSGLFTARLKETAPRTIDFQMTSGSADFDLNAPADFVLRLSKTSGNFSANFPNVKENNTYTYKNGRDDYRINMTSGSIQFNVNE